MVKVKVNGVEKELITNQVQLIRHIDIIGKTGKRLDDSIQLVLVSIVSGAYDSNVNIGVDCLDLLIDGMREGARKERVLYWLKKYGAIRKLTETQRNKLSLEKFEKASKKNPNITKENWVNTESWFAKIKKKSPDLENGTLEENYWYKVETATDKEKKEKEENLSVAQLKQKNAKSFATFYGKLERENYSDGEWSIIEQVKRLFEGLE